MDTCSIEVNQQIMASADRCGQLGVTTQRPKYAVYAIRSKREASFKTWPTYLPVGKEAMVEAGLVYTGVGDSVRCYHCGGGLRNWEAGDKPMLEHAKWYPECAHVLLVKGQEYIDAAGRGEDLDEIVAARSKSTKEKAVIKPDIKSIAAQSCIEMGYSIRDVEAAMATYISKHGHSEYKARDLMEIILDEDEQEPELTGASNVVDFQNEAYGVDEEEVNEEELHKLQEENQRIQERQLCKICLEDRSSIIFLPCGHLVSCAQCAPALVKCPLCRLQVKGQVRALLA